MDEGQKEAQKQVIINFIIRLLQQYEQIHYEKIFITFKDFDPKLKEKIIFHTLMDEPTKREVLTILIDYKVSILEIKKHLPKTDELKSSSFSLHDENPFEQKESISVTSRQNRKINPNSEEKFDRSCYSKALRALVASRNKGEKSLEITEKVLAPDLHFIDFYKIQELVGADKSSSNLNSLKQRYRRLSDCYLEFDKSIFDCSTEIPDLRSEITRVRLYEDVSGSVTGVKRLLTKKIIAKFKMIYPNAEFQEYVFSTEVKKRTESSEAGGGTNLDALIAHIETQGDILNIVVSDFEDKHCRGYFSEKTVLICNKQDGRQGATEMFAKSRNKNLCFYQG